MVDLAMRTLKGTAPETITCIDHIRNVFEAKTGDFTMIARQPRRADTRNHKKAWNQLSSYTLGHYKRRTLGDWFYDSKMRCSLPLYRGEVPGFVPLIIEIDDRIVGFGDMMFMMGDHFLRHGVPSDKVGASNSLCVLDKYHGLGIASYYSGVTTFIAEALGADYAIGFTRTKGGMYNIRMREGWETVEILNNGYAVIKLRLTP